MKNTTTLILVCLLFSLSIHSQNDFEKLWTVVEKYEVENLPKSALKIVENIYSKSQKEVNSPQLIKALFYKSKYSLTLKEDAQLKVIHQFKHHIAKTKFPTKNVLENILANLYWQYFTQNRYKFYNRTNAASSSAISKGDFRTWDLNTLFKEIHHYFKASLKEEAALQEININAFSDILYLQKDSEIYGPTLYDFLAHNALTFYKSSETSVTRPSYKFTIDDPEFITNANRFSKLKISSKDSISLQLNALKVYQKLIAFHLKEDHKKALAVIDIERLYFVQRNATFNNKKDLLLETLEKNNKNHESNGLYAFEIAKILKEKAENYQNSKKEKDQFKNREALKICDAIIHKFPGSFGAKKCAFLKAAILDRSLSMSAEEYIPINTNSRLLISYKNIDSLYFKAYKISINQQLEFNKITKNEAKISFLNTLEKSKEWKATLRNENDYLNHTTEVIVPKLNGGLYLILASNQATNSNTSIYGTTVIQSTNLTLVTNTFDGAYNYQIVDRNNGKPIKNAEIILKNEKQNSRALINKKLVTDSNGFASFRSNNRYLGVAITVKTNNDAATFGNSYLYKNDRKYIKKVPENLSSFIFTDRSIYRPGQTVYLKAIVIKKQGNTSTVFTDEPVDISLKDVNNQTIKTLALKLNEFGSVTGEFILPNNGLTGMHSISINQNSKSKSGYSLDPNYIYISVEEYKRPKFKTEFNPITKSIKLDDNVVVNGFAKAFSGAKITDAKVVYNVYRTTQYPNWYYWRKPSTGSEAQEITNGETTTDASGNFSIPFLAIPDAGVSKENLPIFSYKITADVTDVNGETRGATTIVKVGYHSLLATISMDTKIDKNQKKTILKIDTKNLNGTFVSAKGSVHIYKVRAPKNPLRKRPWSAPEYQDISENAFRKLFPNDPYSQTENSTENSEKGALVFSKYFDTENSKEIQLENTKNWLSGNYIAVLKTEDIFQQAVKDIFKFSIFSTKEKQVPDNKLFAINTDKTNYKVGDLVALQIGSASKDITVVVQVEKKHKIIETFLVKLNNNIKTIKIPINKEDIGGFAIKYHFVNFNYFKSGSLAINVLEAPESNLEIETTIFRDKLQPGAEETWSFRIKNDKNNKVAAEVLAAMYDASLDAFKPHNWLFNPISAKRNYTSYGISNTRKSIGISNFDIQNNQRDYATLPSLSYSSYNWFGFNFESNRDRMMTMRGSSRVSSAVETIEIDADKMEVEETILTATESENEREIISFDGIQTRTNFKETAFFFPQLRTDKNGEISFNFTMPDALTSWKLQLLAHTKDLKSAVKTLQTVTQKELMVVPNAPRFLREGDDIIISAKITNLTNNLLSGISKLILTDAITGKEINTEFDNLDPNKKFTVDKNGNTSVSWNLTIPETVQAVQYKIVAKAGDFSDGEQNVLPVLSNRMLVTETLPMWVHSNETKTFTLDKLKNTESSSLKNHKLTLEVTSNPVWYAIQSLPSLMEYTHECSEQIFSQYYANTLASFVANSNPRIQEVFNAWKNSDALLSSLEKNKELKSLILQETPWLRDAQSETEQKKRIALLFDLNRMKNEQEKGIRKLESIQMSSGGFPWFKGGRDENAFITQHIATGFGHLQKLGVEDFNTSTKKVIVKAVKYLDSKFLEHYEKLLEKASKIPKENKKYGAYLAKNHLSYYAIQYLYMRSFYTDISMDEKTRIAVKYYTDQSVKYWNTYNLYAKGQIALSLFRNNKKEVANKVLNSLRENSITSDELGMYWKSNIAGYNYYQAPVETQALLIEVFTELENDPKTIDNLKIWLLKNKQTNHWKTTKATTEAVYALLLNGSDWTSITEMVAITVGGEKIAPMKLENVKIEAGTGYFKTSWNGADIQKEMANITINKKGNGIAWGGLYWQYFEDLDKITSAKTPLQLNKKLFLKVNSDTGKELQEISKSTPLKVGDLITVRIELQSDRDMEFIHMKDMRASGVEPINVLSAYKWQDNLGYYESTKDAATHFFFDKIPKGTFVFEYDVRINNAGNFNNGITTIQSMYAPEFSSHSEGARLLIQEK